MESKKDVSTKNKQEKPKQKKKGKIAQVYKLHQKGVSVKEIAEKMKLNERIVRSYVWRAANPGKYKALLQRYFAKKRQKHENEAIKLTVKSNSKKADDKKKAEEQ